MILLTMDETKDPEKIRQSYDDEESLFLQIILQGFEDSNDVLGARWYLEENWTLLRKLAREPTMHRFVLRANHTFQCPLINMKNQDDEHNCYEAFEYGPEEMAKEFEAAGLKVYARWKGLHDSICKSSLIACLD